jgi:ribonuclease VapC
LAASRESCISAANYLEAAVVLDRRGHPASARLLDAMLEANDVEVVSVLPSHAYLARQAYRDYGRGSGHPARLNFGDCFAYALAIDTGEPLLFKGTDFTHTDVRSALAG